MCCRSFVLAGGAVAALVLIVFDAGGPSNVWSVAHADHKFQALLMDFGWTLPATWVVMAGWSSNLFSYTADQTVVQRYLTTQDEQGAARGIWTNAVLSLFATVVFFGVGTALYVYYKAHPAELNPNLDTDAIFPWFIVTKMPAGLAGLVIAGVFAAAHVQPGQQHEQRQHHHCHRFCAALS